MIRWKGLLLGAAAFLAAHLVVRARWTDWFGGRHEPWFLNSGTAVAFTAACLFVAGIAATVAFARGDPDDRMVYAVNVAAGAVLAMASVLLIVGPGTIFPIALAIGAAIALFSAAAGAVVVRLFGPGSRRAG